MSDKVAIGIDVGGTFIKSALVNIKGEILNKASTQTQAHDGPKVVIQNILNSIQELLEFHHDVYGIGIGIPGNVKRDQGLIEGCFNVPSLAGIYLVNELEKKLDFPIFIDNDANNAAKGEYLFGAGQNYDHLILLTLGTGIGSGIILNHKLFHGVSDYGGEIGHMILIPEGMLCTCGNYGCFEAYASATAMINQAKQAIKREYPGKLLQVANDEINAQIICQLAIDGDEVCRDIVGKIGKYIAIGCASIINMLNVPLIVIGGGVSEGGDILFHAIDQHVNNLVLPNMKNTFKIVKAEMGNDAGVIGAACSVLMHEIDET